MLAEHGTRGVVINRGDAYEQNSEREFTVPHRIGRRNPRAIVAAAGAGVDSPAHVAFLWGLDAAESDQLNCERLEEAQTLGCQSVVAALAASARAGWRNADSGWPRAVLRPSSLLTV